MLPDQGLEGRLVPPAQIALEQLTVALVERPLAEEPSSSRVSTPRPASIMVGVSRFLAGPQQITAPRWPPNPEIWPEFPGIRRTDGGG